ncbi:A disintegrin and metalloproteinase with thrombospondin motifs 19 [Oryzias melastigma]|uniref:A disintegrin and metalloproteinase with thrombospondin motifs 19 n=1 Tax=Oryzias melastigma TaxID=30732 RepID=A0A834FNN3_ORYME|nr:A disintegrin and metalloproteinase with thrombospondin motifs 19 [Oryzias melastigma]
MQAHKVPDGAGQVKNSSLSSASSYSKRTACSGPVPKAPRGLEAGLRDTCPAHSPNPLPQDLPVPGRLGFLKDWTGPDQSCSELFSMPAGAVLLSCFLFSIGVVSLSTVQDDVEMEVVIPRLLSRQHRGAEERLLVFLPVSGRGLYLDLSRDRHRLSEKLPVEELLRNRSTVVSSFSTERLRFYTGFILNHPGSLAALSTSGGLMGLLQVGGHSMFIEPVDKRPTSFSFSGFKHRLWHRRHAAGAQHPPHRSYVDDHRNRSKVGQEARKRRRSFQLSQHPFTVETVVVADVDVVQHHGADAAQRFLLTVMNMVRRAAHLHS